MTHCNIVHPDNREEREHLRLENLKLKTELDFVRNNLLQARADIESIAERCANGEDVYIVMPKPSLTHSKIALLKAAEP